VGDVLAGAGLVERVGPAASSRFSPPLAQVLGGIIELLGLAPAKRPVVVPEVGSGAVEGELEGGKAVGVELGLETDAEGGRLVVD
jgi:hypothetical protein